MFQRSLLFLLAVSMLLAAAPVLAQECDVTRLGGPTRFSDPMNSVDDMRAMFEANRADIETVLGQVGWTGSADDLFAAVAAGEGIAEASYDKGTFFQWMALREKGVVTSNVNKCYAGKQPFDAFTFSVASNGRRWRFAVPKICGNISLLSSEELPPPPEPPICKISAQCQGSDFSISTAGSAGDMKVTYVSPSGKRGSYSGPFEPEEQGEYKFIVEGSRDGLTCTEEISKQACPPPKLSCDISFSAPEVVSKDEFTVRVNTSPADRAESVSLTASLDGESVLTESLSAPFSWTGSLKKKGTYTFTASAEGPRAQPSDECSATLEVLGPDSRWVWRLFPVAGFGDDEQNLTLSDGERRYLSLDAGRGFGTSLEYIALPWLGVELGAHLLNQDAHFVWDTATVWGMDDDESTNLLFTLGPNFHLTPDRKVDVYLGPFLAYASRDDLNFSDQGFTYSFGLDDETAFGAQLGLDVPVCAKGRCWTFTSAVKWLDLDNDAEFENGPVGALPQDFSLDFSPLFVTVGAGYRF